MPPVNRMVTRGMGTSRSVIGRSSMVSQGFGGLFHAALEEIRRVIRYGGNGVKRVYDKFGEFIVGAKLLRVNETKQENNVSGVVTVRKNESFRRVIVEGFSSRVRQAYEDIKVTVKRHR